MIQAELENAPDPSMWENGRPPTNSKLSAIEVDYHCGLITKEEFDHLWSEAMEGRFPPRDEDGKWIRS